MALRTFLVLIPVLLVLAALAWWLWPRQPHVDAGAAAATLARPLAPPERPLRVYHLGHSLVGRDMPAMLAQLAGDGHSYDSQLGWGTTLQAHWEPKVEIGGFETENDHPRFRPAQDAIASGDYDAVIVTEMVELRAAIKYYDSARYLARWADLAHAADPETRFYLYETWHKLDDPDGWLNRLDGDLQTLWRDRVLLPAVTATGLPIRLIPAGQVMASLVRKIDAQGGVGNLTRREDLFARDSDGALDTIHINDLGAYLVALTHYAVLYHRSPVGLPHRLRRADGTRADAPAPEAARLMQETVWEVVTATDGTGVTQ